MHYPYTITIRHVSESLCSLATKPRLWYLFWPRESSQENMREKFGVTKLLWAIPNVGTELNANQIFIALPKFWFSSGWH